MSRPKPVVILEYLDRKNLKTEQVIASEAVWSVFYKETPINYKTHVIGTNRSNTKYKKVSFSNAGHAFNLADKLNKKFNTTDFAVFKLTKGQQIEEYPPEFYEEEEDDSYES